MKKVLVFTLFFGMISTFSTVSAQEVAVQAEAPVVEKAAEGTAGWKKAGDEIGKAAQSVSAATVDTSKKAWKATKDGSVEAWDKTKDGSKKAWDATREGSQEAWGKTKEGSTKAWDTTKEKSKKLWEKGKQKIHAATAPAPVKPGGD